MNNQEMTANQIYLQQIELEEARNTMKKRGQVPITSTGYDPDKERCPTCQGLGCWSQTSPRGIGGQTITECDVCKGTGEKQ